MRRIFDPLCLAAALAGNLCASAVALAAPHPESTPTKQAEDFDTYVVGGTQVPDGERPDAALVYWSGQPACTGTLIAPDAVLTAGHCIDPEVDKVKLGVTHAEQQGEEIAVATAIAYPDWETTYDIGLLMLEQPATTPPRALATSCVTDAYLVDGAQVSFAGFGAVDIQGEQYPDDLLEASATVLDADCSDGDGCMATINPGGELVAGSNETNPCYGDSGGPLYLSTPDGDYLLGVISRGVDSAQAPCQGGGIFPRVDGVIDWIEQQTGEVFGDDCQPGGEDPGADPENPQDPQEPGDTGDPDPSEPTGPDAPPAGGVNAGCSVGGAGGAAGLLLVLPFLFGLRRRRRGGAVFAGRGVTAMALGITITALGCAGSGDDGSGKSDGPPVDLCQQNNAYGDGVCDRNCPQPDPDCDSQPDPNDGTPTGDDMCQQNGRYGDGTCDRDCPMPDPDCNGQTDPNTGTGDDVCQQNGWYGDGTCDRDCPMPDPDCNGQTDPNTGTGDDVCQQNGYYGDGVCDTDCAQPDPDCNGQTDPNTGTGGDVCEQSGWYGDGVCDTDCAQPDPDCQ